MSFKIFTDSTADLDEQWAIDNQVGLLGLSIEMDGQAYKTVGPDRITNSFLIEKMQAGAKPTTSQVNVGQFEEAFSAYAKEGTPILYLAFSSVLSGTYQSATIAREMILEKYPDARIEVIDTLAASLGEGYLAMLAVEARDAGKSLDEAKTLLEDVVPRLRTYFLVDDLYHLVRGGRLSKSSAIIGSLANIKPLLWLDTEGKLVPLSKTRGRKKGMKEMFNQASQDLDHTTALVAHAEDPEAAESLKEQLLAKDGIDKVIVLPLGPVITSHVGPGTLAVFTVGNQAR